MKKLLLSLMLISYLTSYVSILNAQDNVGIGTLNPNPKALLELLANDKGFIMPRLTTTQRLAINPAQGSDEALMVYDITDSLFYYWDATKWRSLSDVSDAYNISFNFDPNTNTLSITDNGGTLSTVLNLNVNDADSDPNNELITNVVFGAGNILTIEEGGNTWATVINTNDADSDPTNELQDLSLVNNQLSISITNSTVNLAPYLDNTDEQTLTLNNNTLSISNGNSVDLSQYVNTDNQTLSVSGNVLTISNGNTVTINVNDADSDPTNELQNLNLNNNTLSISNGNSVDLSQYVNTDNQTLSFSGTTLSISNGNNVNLASLLDNTDNQTLSLNNNILAISNGNSVDLSSYANDWKLTGNTGTTASSAPIGSAVNNNFIGTTNNVAFVVATNNLERMRVNANGNIGINTTTSGARLDINGSSTANTDIAFRVNNSAGAGTDNTFMVIENDGAIQIGTPPFSTLNTNNIGKSAITIGDQNVAHSNGGNQGGLNQAAIAIGRRSEVYHSQGSSTSVAIGEGNIIGTPSNYRSNSYAFGTLLRNTVSNTLTLGFGPSGGFTNATQGAIMIVNNSSSPSITALPGGGTTAGNVGIGLNNPRMPLEVSIDVSNGHLRPGSTVMRLTNKENTTCVGETFWDFRVGECGQMGVVTNVANALSGFGNFNILNSTDSLLSPGVIASFSTNAPPQSFFLYPNGQPRVVIRDTINDHALYVFDKGEGNSGYFVEEDLGNGIEVSESGDGQGVLITEQGVGNGLQIEEFDNGGGILVTERGNGTGIFINQSAGESAATANGFGILLTSTGTNEPVYVNHNGNIATLTTAGVWTNASDSTLKKNIFNLNYGLKEVMQLRPVQYEMKSNSEKQIGFIAQEIQNIIPEVVNENEGGKLSMSYGNLVALLTKALQEQQQKIEKLEAENSKISNLENEMKTYKAALEDLKSYIFSKAKK